MVSCLRRVFDDHGPTAIAQALMCMNLIAMTRAFALVSLIELALWLLFLLNGRLRAAFVQTLGDLRVQLLLAFFIWIGIAMLWGQAPWESRLEEWWSWRKLVLFPMAVALFPGESSKRAVLWTVIGVSTVYLVLSWTAVFGWVSLDRPPDYLLENDVTQGIMFAASAFFLAMFAIEPGRSVVIRVAVAIWICAFVLNIVVLLEGRGGYLFLVIVTGMTLWWVAGRWRLMAAMAGVVLVLGLLSVSEKTREAIQQGFSEIATFSTADAPFTSMGIRMVMWQTSLAMIQDKPLFGTGSGSYRADYEQQVAGIDGWRGKVVDDPHQQYLHLWAEQGLPGLLLFVGFLGVCLATPVRSWFIFAGITILLATLANSFFSGHFSSFVEGRLFWIVFGAMISGSLMQPSRARDKRVIDGFG
jgi:O-antigen ligase